MALDDKGWILAGGGEKAYKPVKSIINKTLIGYKPNPGFTAPESGDAAAAKKLLTESGEKMPYPIKFTYQSTPTADKQAAAIQQGWNKAGFKVTLDPQGDNYYDLIQKPSADFDVCWAGWGADWPSISTVLPVIFDSRINIVGTSSNGQDYGNYKSDAFNKLMDEAAAAPDVQQQAAKYIEGDAVLGKDLAYIPLEGAVFNFLHGSKVTGYINGAATSGFPDLAVIGVKH